MFIDCYGVLASIGNTHIDKWPAWQRTLLVNEVQLPTSRVPPSQSVQFVATWSVYIREGYLIKYVRQMPKATV